MAKTKLKRISFEEGMELLEKIVSELEGGELDLETSIKKYEEGMKLYKECSEKLADARERIEVLLKTGGEDKVESIVEEVSD